MLKKLLMTHSALVLSTLMFTGATLSAETPGAPAFEVATIRPAPTPTPDLILAGKMHFGMKVDAARIDIGFMSLRDLIVTAYRVKPFQITGPDWITAQRFDIVATIPEGASKDKVPEMLQALLAERFGLKLHRESKEMPVYLLTVGKSGPKFKESPPDADTPASTAPEPDPAKPDGAIVIGAGDQQIRVNRGRGAGPSIEASGGPNGKMNATVGPNGMMHMELQKVTMARLAEMLTPMLDRPVVDRTGLAGNFQIALDLAMQDMMQMARAAGAGLPIPALPPPAPGLGGQTPTASDPAGGSIFASVQQLGLRLEKDKAPFENLVIDHLEKNPTDN
ncbi:MAG TPA: TIGR03435 family protein [Bryobacteraceae bacterium]|nr:TIGR03435 family protein [Bryobacteraceae bacterium]